MFQAGCQASELLRRSSSYCQQITRRHAKNFYHGLKLTPKSKRSAMYAVYAWMRTADDLADETGPVTEKARRLEAFRRQTFQMIDLPGPLPSSVVQELSVGHGLIWPAVRQAVVDFQIPHVYLQAMIDGQLLDQHNMCYETFEQLYDYCYKVASVVGLACITVWGYTGGAATQKLAEYRGVGLQLTNILRDVTEDAARGRVYLPAEDLKRHGYDPCTFAQQLLGGQVGDAFDDLMVQQVARASHYYDLSADFESRLDPSCRPTSLAMARIYRRLLEKIARRPRSVLTQSVRLGRLEKMGIAMRAAWSRGRL